MDNFEIKKSGTVYDAIIVGSGAGGGMAGYVLAHAGLKVLMLEAGPFFDPAKDAQQLKFSYESPRRGASTTRAFGDFDAAYGGWELDGEPYTTKDKTEFNWFRARMLGGRTNHWGRISLRMGPKDFKSHQIDGLTDDDTVLLIGTGLTSTARWRAWKMSRTAFFCRRPSRGSTSCLSSKARPKPA